MNNYRLLTDEEIDILENAGCSAEDWTSVSVAEDFVPTYIYNVSFYGEVNLGVFERNIEVSREFFKHSGIKNATLRDVEIGDNCLIENIGGYINNYTIGEDCYISNTNIIETTEGATYGQGNVIPVLNEMGDGNVMIFSGLTSQMAALMVENANEPKFKNAMRVMIKEYIESLSIVRGTIGNRVKIVNTSEITNTVVDNDCEINGTCRINDCTIKGVPQASVYIGSGVICENSIVCDGSSVLNSAKIENCFVGEACHITNGFTATNSVFFANSYMANGEACATFCGAFSSSHHKSSLLIGTMLSFYNAGSATNFSNHAYKMGPMHHGELARGSKTASGSHIILPANIGAFSVCLGKIQNHPDTLELPFSYIIGKDNCTVVVPGRNICTVGLYRDVHKWSKRDMRTREGQGSIINFEWLNPYIIGNILKGKKMLEDLRAGICETSYIIKESSLNKGIAYYDMAIKMFMGKVINNHLADLPVTHVGKGEWKDLQGLLLPVSEQERLVNDINDKTIETVEELSARFNEIHTNYAEYCYTWAYQMILDYYNIDTITDTDTEQILFDYVNAKRMWIDNIRRDAEKELAMGDVEQEVFDDFNVQLDKELNV